MFGASAASRSVTFSSLAASLASSHRLALLPLAVLVPDRPPPVSVEPGRVHRDPVLQLDHRAAGPGLAGQDGLPCWLAGGAYLPGDPARRRSRVGQARSASSPRRRCPGLLAAQGGGECVHLAGPPPVAARGDRDGIGETRAVRQLIGGGTAESEDPADVGDADQAVVDPPRRLGGGARTGTGHFVRAAHDPLLIAAGPDGFARVPSAAFRGRLCPESSADLPVGIGAGLVAVAEHVQDGRDGDAVPVADLEDADAGLLPFPGVRHLARPPGTQPEDRAEGGQVGGGAEGADRLGGPLAASSGSLLAVSCCFAGCGHQVRRRGRCSGPGPAGPCRAGRVRDAGAPACGEGGCRGGSRGPRCGRGHQRQAGRAGWPAGRRRRRR